MPTLILSRRFTSDSNTLWKAASEARWNVHRLSSYKAPDELWGHRRGDPELVFYGESLLADAIRDELGLRLVEPKPDWLPSIPYMYRHRDVFLKTFREALDHNQMAFFKPADDKTFPAGVYLCGEKLRAFPVDDNGPVLISEPVLFEAEFRAFILDRRIAALSEAYTQIVEHPKEGARDFLEVFLEDPTVDLPPAVVIDVGYVRKMDPGPTGEGWAVIEANPAWASGLYDCDPAAVLQVLQRANHGTAADARWVR